MLSSISHNTAFTSAILTNRTPLFPCNSCYIPTLIARSSNNHPLSPTPPRPVFLPLQEIWRNIPLIPIIRTFTNGSTPNSHNFFFTHDTNNLIQPPPLLYEIDHLLSTVAHATIIYQQNIIIFLASAEWCTTLEQHPTRTPTHPLNAAFAEWHTYTPNLTHKSGSFMSLPKYYIDTFRHQV